MRKWQRDRRKRRTNPSAPQGDSPAPLRPIYPETQEQPPQPPEPRVESAPPETGAAPAQQRRKRGGRRKKKGPSAPSVETASAEVSPPHEAAGATGPAAPPQRTRARRRRGAGKPVRAPEPPPPAPTEAPAPEVLQPEYPELAEVPAPQLEPEPLVDEAEPQIEEPPPQAAQVEAPSEPELVAVSGPAHLPEFPPELKPAHGAPTQPQKRPKGIVVLAIGLPGSGKTTWFKRRGVTPLSSDLLRTILFDNITEQRYQNLVFGTLRSLLRARLIARMPWNYVDATNLSPRERRHWIQMARNFGFEVHAVFFDVPLEVCLDRNRRRQRIVPEEIMHRMASKLRPPRFEEGFSKITVVRIKKQPQQ